MSYQGCPGCRWLERLFNAIDAGDIEAVAQVMQDGDGHKQGEPLTPYYRKAVVRWLTCIDPNRRRCLVHEPSKKDVEKYDANESRTYHRLMNRGEDHIPVELL